METTLYTKTKTKTAYVWFFVFLMALSLSLVKERSVWRIPSVSSFRTLVCRAGKALRLPRDMKVTLAFVGDRTMEKLNHRYRGKRRTTDVLSFCYTKDRNLLHGDLVIAIPQARRQARTIGHTLEDELQFLFVHGFLHLLGYDHERSHREEKMMVRLQERILGRV